MSEKLTHLALFLVFFLAGGTFGLALFSTPTPVIQPAPTPAVAPPDRDLVIGLSELLVDVNREAKAARAELSAVKAEARQIISAMIGEIQRLQKRPTVTPNGTTAGTARPPDVESSRTGQPS